MVCLRCQIVVKNELERLNLEYESVKMGEATIKEPIAAKKIIALKGALLKSGLEIIDDKKSMLIEKIKAIVIEHIHYSEEPLKEKFSIFIAEKLQYDYTYLSNLFAVTNGITLEHFIIQHKIEKVKELLLFDDLKISEIAYKMNYSSASHLSKQFKKVTGFTAKYFKELKKLRFDEQINTNKERNESI